MFKNELGLLVAVRLAITQDFPSERRSRVQRSDAWRLNVPRARAKSKLGLRNLLAHVLLSASVQKKKSGPTKANGTSETRKVLTKVTVTHLQSLNSPCDDCTKAAFSYHRCQVRPGAAASEPSSVLLVR